MQVQVLPDVLNLTPRMSKAKYPTRIQQFRVKKAFREGHERIFGPGKFPETDSDGPSELKSGSCEITDHEILRLDQFSAENEPWLQIGIHKGAPFSGGVISPQPHPRYEYTLQTSPDGSRVLEWKPHDERKP